MTELIYTIVMTHITIVCVTLFLHRGQTHKAIEFHPILSHFMRFWLWLTTGMVTKQWVAVHRKHHRFSDIEGDPHSPWVYGLKTVLFKGALLYNDASKNTEMINQYGVGTPNDYLENKLYTPHSRLGILIMLLINLWLFGPVGLFIWIVQMVWIPFWAAGVVNGIGHWFGYRNKKNSNDNSRNIIPIGIIIGGEELHANHHLDPASAKLSRHWFEFDIGWFYIQLFKIFGLLKLRNSP